MARPPGPAKARILDAAQRLFAERGVGETPTVMITKEAGVAEGSLFYHFGSKAGLLAALLDERGFAPELDELLDAADPEDPAGTMRRVGHALLEAIDERGDVVRIFMQEALTRAGRATPFQAALRSEFDRLGAYLTGALPQRLDALDGNLLARTFLTALVFEATIVPTPVDRETFIDRTVATLLTEWPKP